jgi:hypothetical protein
MGVNWRYLSCPITHSPLVTYYLYLGMFVYIPCMWFVTLYAESSIATPYRAPGTGYGTRTYRVRRYIYTVYMRKSGRCTRQLCVYACSTRVYYQAIITLVLIYNSSTYSINVAITRLISMYSLCSA